MRNLRIYLQSAAVLAGMALLTVTASHSQQTSAATNAALMPAGALEAAHLAPRLSLIAFPQNPTTTGLPSADEILAKYEKFMGGKAALAKVMTRTVWSRRIVDTGAPGETILLRYSK